MHGEFDKAEDALFAMLDAEPNNTAIVEFGIAFYQRLLAQSDTALAAANLPRVEVEQGPRMRKYWSQEGAKNTKREPQMKVD